MQPGGSIGSTFEFGLKQNKLFLIIGDSSLGKLMFEFMNEIINVAGTIKGRKRLLGSLQPSSLLAGR